MSIDFFDTNFQMGYDKLQLIEDVDAINNNVPCPNGNANQPLVSFIALLHSVINVGGYDEMYMYVSDDDIPTVRESFCRTLTSYGIGSVVNDSSINLPKKNATIMIVSMDDVMQGKYDYVAASKIVVDVIYAKHSMAALTDLHDRMKSCLDFSGTIIGFIDDFSNMRLIPTKPDIQVGTFRKNEDTDMLEVYDGAQWLSLTP